MKRRRSGALFHDSAGSFRLERNMAPKKSLIRKLGNKAARISINIRLGLSRSPTLHSALGLLNVRFSPRPSGQRTGVSPPTKVDPRRRNDRFGASAAISQTTIERTARHYTRRLDNPPCVFRDTPKRHKSQVQPLTLRRRALLPPPSSHCRATRTCRPPSLAPTARAASDRGRRTPAASAS